MTNWWDKGLDAEWRQARAMTITRSWTRCVSPQATYPCKTLSTTCCKRPSHDGWLPKLSSPGTLLLHPSLYALIRRAAQDCPPLALWDRLGVLEEMRISG